MQTFDRVGVDPVEYQILAVDTTTDTGPFVPRHELKSARHIDEALAALDEFAHEADGTSRIVLRDEVADPFQIG